MAEFFLTVSPFSGFSFWLLVGLLVLASCLLRVTGTRRSIRNITMIALSVLTIILAQYDKKHGGLLPALFCLFALTLMVYCAGRVLMKSSSGQRRSGLLWGPIVIIVLVLCYFKYSYFQALADGLFDRLGFIARAASDQVGGHFFLLGVSYFSFKFIHFLVDVYNKRIKEVDLLTFINYTFFFPSFFSGPINRYGTFVDSVGLQPARRDFSGFGEGIKRIINGLFKKVLATLLLPHSVTVLALDGHSVSRPTAILGIYAYMFYVYFDFSGYSDMAIGSARLVGINLPENFNYPFLRRNLQQFWANWHMSLTSWLTDYIYWPLVKKVRHLKSLRNSPVVISCIAIVVTFFVCGLWHGDGLNFVIWGLYHGIGLAILNIYTQFEKRYVSAAWRKRINATRWGYGVSCFITFQYAAFGFLLFGSDISRIKQFLGLFF